MAVETRSVNERAIAALDLGPDPTVLDLGCGPGQAARMILDRLPDARVIGVDPSASMRAVAAQRNARHLASGRLTLLDGQAEAIPLPEGCADAVLCVHVLYFWRDRPRALAELARVLRPGGRAAIVFHPADHRAHAARFPDSIYTFPPRDTVLSELDAAAFDAVDPTKDANPALPVCLLAQRRRLT